MFLNKIKEKINAFLKCKPKMVSPGSPPDTDENTARKMPSKKDDMKWWTIKFKF